MALARFVFDLAYVSMPKQRTATLFQLAMWPPLLAFEQQWKS